MSVSLGHYVCHISSFRAAHGNETPFAQSAALVGIWAVF